MGLWITVYTSGLRIRIQGLKTRVKGGGLGAWVGKNEENQMDKYIGI